jgi:hypothetical protein
MSDFRVRENTGMPYCDDSDTQRLTQADRFLVIGSDHERVWGPMMTRRNAGRVALMGVGNQTKRLSLEWYAGSGLANEGFQTWFRRVQIADKLKQNCEAKAAQELEEGQT